jgi:hypothetical protein
MFDRTVALRFQPHVRRWVYGRLIEDSTGRLVQLATTCPGALIFAFALDQAGRGWSSDVADAGARLLADAIAGRRLDRVLAHAVEAWAVGVERAAGSARPVDPVWDRMAWAFGPERERLLAQQRLLVRRAGPMVVIAHLFLPPPIAFAPEDIPRPVRDNARWFSVVKCSPVLLTAPTGEGRERLHGVSAFVSRNAASLARPGRRRRARTVVARLVEYAAATNRWPVRGTNANRYIEEIEVRRAQIAAAQALGALESRDLPEPPKGTWRDGRDEIVPITRGDALIREGGRMGHCVVAATERAVFRGWSAVYHATIDCQPMTIEIRRLPAGWRIAEAKGFANREPTDAEWSVLRRWEAQLP